MTAIVVIGDALLDRDWSGAANRLCADSFGPVVDLDTDVVRPGGAGLTAIAAARCGADVALVTALGRDDAGAATAALLRSHGVEVVDLGLDGATPEKVRIRVGGATVARVDRGGEPSTAVGAWDDRAASALATAGGVLLSDYGRGVVAVAAAALHEARPDVPVVWDPHPRGCFPSPRVDLATPNLAEARHFADDPSAAPAALAAALAQGWGCAVAVTCGADGVALGGAGDARHVPTVAATGDACGAGDWFAAAATVAAARGARWREAVVAGAQAARRWVAGDQALAPPPHRSGLVVTSGCFDVLHVGHLELLRHARSLGDHLVVLLNSDRSVRGIKGPGRPVNHERDRAALLRGLACVDDVVVFDEPTPCRALERLRPRVFVKGADYQDVAIPEIATLAAWGGRVEFAPLVPGRSTTRVLQIARDAAGREAG